ncbi:hypothetical protein ACFC09_45840 [Streptomyces sp. NPDC056161]|uniref:hypothetical protein n=1 Tax=Streptomyces sp. NPDC056161 TaxID=3345732 RepID=UPI0035E3AD67
MIWWFKARRIAPVLVPSLLTCLVVIGLAHAWTIELPGLLTGSHNRIFLLYLVPILPASALNLALTSRLTEAETAAAREVRRYDLALICGAAAALTLGGVLIGAASGAPEAWASGRNMLFLTGLMLLAHAIKAEAAVAAPSAWVFLVMFFGFDQYRYPYFWSILPHAPGHLISLAAAILTFAAGLVAFATQRRAL